MMDYPKGTWSGWDRDEVKTVIIEDGVTSIGAGAFKYSYNLENITIPNSIIRIGDNAFYRCAALPNISFEDNSELTSIGQNAFYDCENLISISIPTNVTSIGDYAFYDCRNLTDINLSSNCKLSSIGESAFENCESLTSMTIPGSAISIGNSAFENCESMTSITILDSIASIGSEAFYGCSSLSNVSFASSSPLATIGERAFSNCSNLESIAIPDGTTSIGDNAFERCTKLTSVSIPNSVTSIGYSLFWECSSLVRATIPENVTSLGSYVFYDCTSLVEATLNEKVGEINFWDFFSGCSSLLNVTISPEHQNYCSKDGAVYNKSGKAFVYCPTGRKEISIPNGVTRIESSACDNSNLISIEIPSSVTSIRVAAFYECNKLRNVAYIGTQTQWQQIDIQLQNECLTWATIHYHTQDNWSEPTYTWSTDYTTITATRVCADDETHTEKETVGVTTEITDATCTTSGNIIYTSAPFTNEAFHECTFTQILDALGHNWISPVYIWDDDNRSVVAISLCKNNAAHMQEETANTTSAIIAPKCDEDGKTTYTAIFTNPVFTTQTKEVAIPAIGHVWGEVAYSWSDDNRTMTASHSCSRDESHIETETVEVTSEVTKPATCEAKGETTYTATFENPAFEPQAKTLVDVDALDHDWNEAIYTWADDNTYVTATRICLHNDSHKETETVMATSEVTKESTCAAKGETTYTSTDFQNEAFQAQSKVLANIDELPHTVVSDEAIDATCTATGLTNGSHCSVCGEILEAQEIVPMIEHSYAIIPAVAPTCEEPGFTNYVACSVCGEILVAGSEVPALEHAWGEVTYTWSNDDISMTASRICANDPAHVEMEAATIVPQITKVATCEEKGETTYTANFENPAFVAQTKTVEDIAAIGHAWSETTYTWTDGNKSVIAARTCTNNTEHIEMEEANVTAT